VKTLEIQLDDETAKLFERFVQAHDGDRLRAFQSMVHNQERLERYVADAEAKVGEPALREILRRADEDLVAGRSITLEELEEKYGV
jgi:hypothetical protein